VRGIGASPIDGSPRRPTPPATPSGHGCRMKPRGQATAARTARRVTSRCWIGRNGLPESRLVRRERSCREPTASAATTAWRSQEPITATAGLRSCHNARSINQTHAPRAKARSSRIPIDGRARQERLEVSPNARAYRHGASPPKCRWRTRRTLPDAALAGLAEPGHDPHRGAPSPATPRLANASRTCSATPSPPPE
jgi:hypothetical protein